MEGATSTLTVPVTPDGKLAESVRKNLMRSRQPPGTKVKVVEDGGISSKSGIVKSNQWNRKKTVKGVTVSSATRRMVKV